MATEELSIQLSLEGFAEFESTLKKLDSGMDGVSKSASEMGAESQKSGQAMSQAGRAYDETTARANKLKLAQAELAQIQKQLTTETDALKRAQLEVRADNLAKQIQDLSSATSDGAQGTRQFGLSLTDLKSGIDMAIGAAKAFYQTAKQAFDFAQEGAMIEGTRQSFDKLGLSLREMREASQGTIDDMTLMSGALNVMAGASDGMAGAFSDAMPQLLAMAKAASDLNPSLGDTNYMFNSITLAAKRQSMQIADNLGIIVRQGEAYQKYADSIGVAVTALTDEQKQVAFLNGLLEAGNILIEQAGASTERTANSYAQLTAEAKNAGDELKVLAAQALTPAVRGIVELLTFSRRVTEAQHDFTAAAQASGMAWEDYARRQLFSMRASGQMTQVQNELRIAMREAGYSLGEINAATRTWESTVETAVQVGLGFNEMLSEADYEHTLTAQRMTAEAFAATGHEARLAAQHVVEFGEDTEAAAVAAAENLNLAVESLSTAFTGKLGQAFDDHAEKTAELTATGEELRAKIAELEGRQWLTAAQREELAETRAQLEENNAAIDGNARAHEEAVGRIIFSMAQQVAAQDGFTQQELDYLATLGEAYGVLDDRSAEALRNIRSSMDSVTDGTLSAEAAVYQLRTSIDGLENREITVGIRWDIPALPQVLGEIGGAPIAAYAAGGTTSGGNMLVGEHGPELLTGVPGGARVLSNATTARQFAQSNTTNNFNLTTNSMTRPGGLALEFAAMEMGSR